VKAAGFLKREAAVFMAFPRSVDKRKKIRSFSVQLRVMNKQKILRRI